MIVATALGAAVGVIMGLTGAGGGILAVPLLVFGLGLTLTQAGPIGLLAVGISAGIGALIGLRAKTVRYRAALLIAFSGIVMAPLGVWLTHRLDTDLLTLAFAAILLSVAGKSISESTLANASRPDHSALPCIRDLDTGRFMWTSKCAGALSVSGGVTGVLSGLLGVGGGFVMIPALQRYTDLDARSVVATSLSVIALISLAGVTASIATGYFDLQVAAPFAGGSVGGMVLGSAMSSRLPAKYLKRAFAVICIVVAVGLLIKAVSA